MIDRKVARLILLTLIAYFPLSTWGAVQNMYVTDRVTIPMRGFNEAEAPIVKQLISGAPIQVLEREGALFKIRTEDGSVGWVDPNQLSSEKPVQILYAEQRDRYSKALEEIKVLQSKSVANAATVREESKLVAGLRDEIKSANEQRMELEVSTRENTTKLADAYLRVAALETENIALKARPVNFPVVTNTSLASNEVLPIGTVASTSKEFSVALPWFVLSLALVLLLGSAIGAYAVDRYVRKRHGGFRIY